MNLYYRAIFIAILTILTSLGFSYFRPGSGVSNPSKTSKNRPNRPFPIFLRVAQDHINSLLQTEEEQVWDDFNSLGITKEQLNQYIQEYPIDDNECLKTFGDPKPLSAQTQLLINQVVSDFNISGDLPITCTYKGNVEAASTDTALMINEKLFSQLSLDVQTFIIAHELQHFLHKDPHTKWLIKKIAQDKQIDQQKIESFYNNYIRFTELRADLKAATKNFDYAIAYISYAQSLIREQGNHGGKTHPNHVKRLQLATNIIEQMTKKSA